MNKNIIDNFTLLINQIKQQIDTTTQDEKEQLVHSYRLRAVTNILSILKKIPYKITSSDQLKNTLPGIGKGSLARIQEILDTNTLKELKNPGDHSIIPKSSHRREDNDKLEKIYGIGKKTAQYIYKTYGIKNIKELKDKYNHGELKFKLSKAIQQGLQYADQIKTNIPRENIENIYIYLLEIASKIDKYLHLTVCGSYRRQKKTSNDIDVIITHYKNKKGLLHEFIKELINDHFIIASLTDTHVKTKYMGICSGENKDYYYRIDIRYIPYESYYFAVLYFTGSKTFNQKMRLIAINNGYKLNEYGLYDRKTGEQVLTNVTSEKVIFEKLNMQYIPPEERS